MMNLVLRIKTLYARIRHLWLKRIARRLPAGDYRAIKEDGETMFFQIICGGCMRKMILLGKLKRGEKLYFDERRKCGVCGDRKKVLFSYVFKKDGTVQY